VLENALDDRDIAGKRGSEQLITREVLYQLSYVGACPAQRLLPSRRTTVSQALTNLFPIRS
jgi:hypothetical protein